jgi:hypothetical protein
MKKRYLYALLFGLPGLFIAGIVSLLVFGGILGILWLFVFGDDPWPVSPERWLAVLLVVAFLAIWLGAILAGYLVGKKLEKEPAMNWMHVLISVGLTLLFIFFILLQQWSVGNLGPKSDSMLCSDFCTEQGYSASGMPPQDSGDRSCICYDKSGNEALKVPWTRLDPDAPK